MENEYDDLDLDGEEAEAPAAQTAPAAENTEPPELSKLRKENHSLRERLRRTELEQEYGPEVVDAVKRLDIPLRKWKDAAALIQGLRPSGEAETQATEEAPKEEPTPTEQRLAAVTKTASNPASGQVSLTRAEFEALMRQDPEEGWKRLRGGQVTFNNPQVQPRS